MTIIADTNLIVRILADDDPDQRAVAVAELERADRVVLTNSCLCEIFWVLTSRYKVRSVEVAQAIEALADQVTFVMDRPTVRTALAMVESGGDFADGIVAQEGRHLGGTIVVSFDRQAVRLLKRHGHAARLPGT